MHAKIITFAASAFIALGNAVPMNNEKRDVVWVTEVETAVETVGVTTTVWVDPTGAPSAPEANNRHGHGHRSKHQKQESETTAIEVKPTPSPEPEVKPSSSSEEASSSQAAPEPASYEAPAAPSVEPTTSAAPAPATSAQPESTTSTPEPAPATTEAPVAPSSSYEAPASSYEAPSSSAAAPSIDLSNKGSSSSGSSSSDNPASGQSFTGELTYFTPGMGACGHTSGEGDNMVAISQALFDKYTVNGNPNLNPLCGQTLTIKGGDGADHKATIWDRCPGCAEADLDLPEKFFNTVTMKDGKPADGRAHGVEWSMN